MLCFHQCWDALLTHVELVHQHPQAFFCKDVLQVVGDKLALLHEPIRSRCWTCIYLCWTLWHLREHTSPACFDPSEWQPYPSVYWLLSVFWCHLLKCSPLSCRLLVKTVSSKGSSTEHRGMPLVTSHCSLSFAIPIPPIRTYFIDYQSSPYLPSLATKMLWYTMSKA